MKGSGISFTVRLPAQLIREVERVQNQSSTNRSAAVRLLLERGLLSLKEGYLSESLIRSLAHTRRTAQFNRRAIQLIGEICTLNNILMRTVLLKLDDGKSPELADLLAESRVESENFIKEATARIDKRGDRLSLVLEEYGEDRENGGREETDAETQATDAETQT